jgi:hypothetical protein
MNWEFVTWQYFTKGLISASGIVSTTDCPRGPSHAAIIVGCFDSIVGIVNRNLSASRLAPTMSICVSVLEHLTPMWLYLTVLNASSVASIQENIESISEGFVCFWIIPTETCINRFFFHRNEGPLKRKWSLYRPSDFFQQKTDSQNLTVPQLSIHLFAFVAMKSLTR